MEISLEKGFKEADTGTLPTLTGEMVFSYITKLADKGLKSPTSNENIDETKYKINYVQYKRTKTLCELKGLFFDPEKEESKYTVFLVVNENKNEITNVKCEECDQEKGPCTHAIAFLFWTYRKSSDKKTNEIFWPTEKVDVVIEEPTQTVVVQQTVEEQPTPAVQIKHIFMPDDILEGEEYDEFTEDEGQLFLKNVLDEMERIGLTETELYKHCRPVIDEFEPLYIHHTMLDNANNYIKDFKSFIMHMENQGNEGLFERLAEVSIFNYKKPLWMEAQYGRIRCSLLHRITNRKDATEDSGILEAILCQDREWNCEDKKQLKEHKRFILKQTEKLENKIYRKCGLLLSENYPYICASPDGITDDHIVEIKAPKSDEEFEKYLVGKETIAPKYMAQIQMQMYLANVTKALYCVLSPLFDTNGALHYVWVQADMEMVASLLSHAEDYWKYIVFPRLKKIYIEE